ncbi:MATE family efflux transporter [Chloroflexota bacterium]
MADAETEEVGSDTRRSRATVGNRDWTKGSITRNLVALSWPIIVSDGLRMIGPTVDLIWVGKLGADSIAGVGISAMAVHAVMSGRTGIGAGIRAMIARFMGAGDTKSANLVVQQAFVISAAYAIVMAIIGILFAEPILSIFGVEAEVVAEGAAYMRVAFIGSATMSFLAMVESIMQASGDSVTPMRISIFYRLFHVGLVPFLIFGWWVFPRMGVSGAALTSVIANGLAMVIGLWILFTGRSRLRLTLENFSLDLNIIWRIIKIGIPAAIQMAERSFGQMLIVWFMSPFGTNAVAAHTMIQRIIMFITNISMGFGRGAAVLVGQNLGAQQPERAEKSAWLAVGFAECVMMTFCLVILLAPGGIIRIFNSEPGLVGMATVFLRIGIISYLAFSIDLVIMQCLAGAGDTLPAMVITLMSSWVVLMPLAYFLPRVTDLGVYGVRWAMVIAIVAGAVAYVVYFRLGRWKYKKV